MPLSALLTLAVALATSQAGKLELSNIRATYGLHGAARPDFKILPGEILQVTFDIGGLTPDEVGRLRFAAKMSLKDPKGESIYQEDLGELPPVLNLLGGGKVPHVVIANTGLKQTPGQYLLQVTVTDLNAKKEGSFTRDFTVQPLEFGLVRFHLCYDRHGQLPAPPMAVVGQTIYVNAVAVGYKFDMKDQQGSLAVEMSIRDEQDKPVHNKPLTGEFKNIENDVQFVPFRFDLPVHRGGRYRIVLKATDNVAKKSVTLTVPFLAVEQK